MDNKTIVFASLATLAVIGLGIFLTLGTEVEEVSRYPCV